jgi:DNA primase
MYGAEEKIRFIEKAFGPCKISPNGSHAAIQCPICKHKDKKKLSIRLADDLNHCWVCGFAGRSLLPLLMKHASRDAVDEYKFKFYQGKQYADTEKLAKPEEIPVLPADFRLLALLKDVYDPNIRHALKYLKARGLTDRDLWYFKFGVSSDFAYHNRIILPSFDAEGNLNFVTARTTDKDVRLKYLNSRNPKMHIVFNDINIDWSKPLTLVEGPFDLTKCNDNATCLMGSELSEASELFNSILFHKTPICLALDDDMQVKAQKIAKKLAEYDISVKMVDLGSHHDPGEMSREEFAQALAVAKDWDWFGHMSFKIKRNMACSFKI